MKKWKRTALDFFYITVAVVFTAAALDVFLIPNKLAAGGISGLSTVLHYTTGVPVGLTMLFFNIILLIAGTRIYGPIYGGKTIYGAVSVSLLVDLLAPFLPEVTGDPILAALYGGIISGIGMGIVFRAGGNTGGTDIIAQIIQKFSNIPLGKLFLLVDGMVMVAAAFAFGIKLALYGMISVLVMGYVIDLVQEGISSEKVVYIISEKNDMISKRILTELDRGATLLLSRGAYTGAERETIFVVIERKQVEQLLRIVRQTDADAFVIIHDAREVIGHGFRPWK